MQSRYEGQDIVDRFSLDNIYYVAHYVTDKLEKISYWIDQSKIHMNRGDTYYSGVCFEKAHGFAEELLSLHSSEKTFLVSSEKEYLENIIGKEI